VARVHSVHLINIRVEQREADADAQSQTTSTDLGHEFASRYFNDFYDDYTDVNQFGSVHGRSTIHALLKVMHELFVAADCSQNIIGVNKSLLTSVKHLMLLTTMYY